MKRGGRLVFVMTSARLTSVLAESEFPFYKSLLRLRSPLDFSGHSSLAARRHRVAPGSGKSAFGQYKSC
jgi:hypothetical protein